MTEQQREQVLANRRRNLRPWHNPPHFPTEGCNCFHLSAACYEHSPIIGITPVRMAEFQLELVNLFAEIGQDLYAWCILPNHWHALIRGDDISGIIKVISQLHGRTSFEWNREDARIGRKCWHGCADRRIRSDRHFYVARNYIHHNPVKHGYVEKWEEWPYSSAKDYISNVGRDAVIAEWEQYPILDMGKDWDN